MSCCPTCGAALAPSRLIVDMNTNTVALGGRKVVLLPREAEVLHVLKSEHPKAISGQRIAAKLSGVHGAFIADSTVKVHLSRIRTKLRGMPLVIENVSCLGYRLIEKRE